MLHDLASQPEWDVPALPIVIGVTGHLQLSDDERPRLEEAVCKCLEKIKQTYPGSPLVLLSPLAEGADRLVARLALASSIRLVAPLPMSDALYMQDFETAESKAEFKALSAQATPAFVLPLVGGYTEDQVSRGGLARDSQYAHVGTYIVRHCQILLALWNGVRHQPESVGGTAQIVDFALTGVMPPFAPTRSPLDTPEPGGVVYHITTTTPNHATLPQFPGSVQQLPADARDFARRTAVLKRIADFGQDWQTLGAQLQRPFVKNMGSLLPAALGNSLSPDLQLIRQRYAIADSLAQYFLKRTRSAHHMLLVLVGIAVIFFEVFVHFADYVEMGRALLHAVETQAAGFGLNLSAGFPVWLTDAASWLEQQARVVLLLYLGLMGLAWWSYEIASRNRYQAKYLDYRALAEAMRVQFFWRIAGVGGVDESVADHYLGHQASELDWIRSAIRVWSIPTRDPVGDLEASAEAGPNDATGFVGTHWIEDQQDYFHDSATHAQNGLNRHRHWWRLMVWSSLGLTVVQVALNRPNPALILLITMLLAVAALDREAVETRATAEHARAYTRMAALYANAWRYMNEQGASRDMLTRLGREALTENAEWLLLHRERPIHLPMR